jgi:hypothetical protein
MTQNLVSMTITQEDEDDVDASLDRIFGRIKFVSLGEENRRRLRMMKAKRAEFGREMIRTMQQHPEMVPPGFDLAGAAADLDALERMERIDARIQQLATLSRDTRDALGSDVLAAADVGYRISKTFGPALGLGELLKDLKQRFSRPRKKNPTTPSEPTE